MHINFCWFDRANFAGNLGLHSKNYAVVTGDVCTGHANKVASCDL